MKITKNIVDREHALTVSSDYVALVEGNFSKFRTVFEAFQTLRQGQKAITFVDGKFVMVKITSINHNDFRAVDGPVVRVGNGEYTWRVDGIKLCLPTNCDRPYIHRLEFFSV